MKHKFNLLTLVLSILAWAQMAFAVPPIDPEGRIFRASLAMKELSSTPSTPPAGYMKVYPKDDGKLYTLDSSGAEKTVGDGTTFSEPPTFVQQTSGGITPPGTVKLYPKLDGNFYSLDEFGNERPVGSGGGSSGVNLILGGDGALGNRFQEYADAAGAAPVDGEGGSPDVSSGINTVNPLAGDADFVLTKDAANRQGQGWAFDFFVDVAYRAKSHKIRFDYIVNSGTFTAGTRDAISDVTVWIVDVTNGTVIQPSNVKLFSTSTAISDVFEAEFQTSASGYQYRLLFHVATTSASAYSLRVDNIFVGPSQYVFGTPITDGTPYTPTITTISGTMTNYTAYGWWSRRGDRAIYTGRINFTGAPGTWGDLRIGLPAGHVPDNATGKIPSYTGDASILTPSLLYHGSAQIQGTTIRVLPTMTTTHTGNAPHPAGTINSTFPATLTSGDAIMWSVEVPIVGWSSSVQMSDSYSSRTVAARAYAGTDQTGVNPNSSFTKLTFGAKSYDLTNSFDATNSRFVAPTPGIYSISAVAQFLSTNVAAARYFLSVYKNGSRVDSGGSVFPSATTSFGLSIDTDIEMAAGDYLEIYVYSTANHSANTLTSASGTINSHFTVHKISGPTAIAATERISFRASLGSGSAIGTSLTDVVFSTKNEDSHGAYNTSTGEFTAPAAGSYHFSWGLVTAPITLATNSERFFSTLLVDGVQVVNGFRSPGTGGNNNHASGGAVTLYLNAGQKVKIRATSSVATNFNADVATNFFSGHRVGP